MAERILFRSMTKHPDGLPEEGDPAGSKNANTLGVRIDGADRDIEVSATGMVSPGTGGMSTYVNNLWAMPHFIIPRRYGRGASGSNHRSVFRLPHVALPQSLDVELSKFDAHAEVQPAAEMRYQDYHVELISTRGSWVEEVVS